MCSPEAAYCPEGWRSMGTREANARGRGRSASPAAFLLFLKIMIETVISSLDRRAVFSGVLVARRSSKDGSARRTARPFRGRGSRSVCCQTSEQGLPVSEPGASVPCQSFPAFPPPCSLRAPQRAGASAVPEPQARSPAGRKRSWHMVRARSRSPTAALLAGEKTGFQFTG